MEIRITPGPLMGTVAAIPSKSDVHRALICAAFADGDTRIRCGMFSKDIEATMRCLSAAGATVIPDKAAGMILVKPASPLTQISDASQTEPVLSCGESGSTLRFLLPVTAAAGIPATFTGEGELPRRPLSELLDVLSRNGVHTDHMQLPIRLYGKLEAGTYRIAGNVSSQYISGLLLAAPLCGADCRISLSSALQSAAYVDMTIDTMSRFGVRVDRTEDGFTVPAQSYHTPGTYETDGDWSNAAFWLCAAAMHKRPIRVTGLRKESLQGDRAIQRILEDQFALREPVGSADRKAAYTKRVIDASGIPDLVPILAALSAVTPGVTEIINAGRLRLKECDRLSATAELLTALGARVTEHAEGLTVTGCETLRGGARVDGHNDHRIVMTAAILASVCEETVAVTDAGAVSKSYPGFFEDFRLLGGIADVI